MLGGLQEQGEHYLCLVSFVEGENSGIGRVNAGFYRIMGPGENDLAGAGIKFTGELDGEEDETDQGEGAPECGPGASMFPMKHGLYKVTPLFLQQIIMPLYLHHHDHPCF